jgi:hypothetical protein
MSLSRARAIGAPPTARRSRASMLIPVIVIMLGIALGPGVAWMPETHLQAATGNETLGFNVDALSLDAAGRSMLFARVGDVHFGWIRQQIRWSSYEPTKGNFQNDYVARVDTLVDLAAARGIHILFSTVNSPAWAGSGGGLPRNPQDYADFVSFMARRYGTKVQAYEIWNEENYAHETGGRVDVAAYLPVLRAGYQAIKAVNRQITVVFGGLTPTAVTGHPEIAIDDVEFLTKIYALNGGEVKRYYDVLGVHPGSTCNPPETSWPDQPATNSCGTEPDGSRSYTTDNAFYFKRLLQMRQVMERNGEGGKKMWLTEFGWASTTQPLPDYAFAGYVSEAQQAQYLLGAIALGHSYPWMGQMFVWNLNFQVTSSPSDEKWGYGILRKDWSPRPAYDALKNMRTI